MQVNEERRFDIDRQNNPNCPTHTGGNYPFTYYTVKKENINVPTALGIELNKLFFVIDNNAETFIPQNVVVHPNIEQLKRIYYNEIAYIACSEGLVRRIWINPGNPQTENYYSNVRLCGIMKILMTLCLRDPEINDITNNPNNNKAYRLLSTIQPPNQNQVSTTDTVLLHCSQFVGLKMPTKKRINVDAFFSAAIESGYHKLLINTGCNVLRRLTWFTTDSARDHYCPNRGVISNGACVHVGDHPDVYPVFRKSWFFCHSR